MRPLAGRLSYDVDPDRKLLAVSVSDMLEGHDYHLRLCRKDFICKGAGSDSLVGISRRFFASEMRRCCIFVIFVLQIRKEEPVKKALLRFSRPLPCLCIEVLSLRLLFAL